MPSVTAFSPHGVLDCAGLGLPSFVIRTVNSMLVEALQARPSHSMKLRIDKTELQKRLFEAAKEVDANLLKIHWENFPMIFSKYWDIQIPPVCPGGFRGADLGCYVFTPRGVSGYDY